MAPLNGHSFRSSVPANGHVNTRIPPPSSILATHIVPVNGTALPHVDPKIFAQLIEECLGSDDDAQPRVGTDVAVNHRLICVIVKAGIDPPSVDQDDPFKAQGRNNDQVNRCLDVIDIAIRRSPLVLYVPSGPDDIGPEDHNVPLFVWLIPKLLSLLGDGHDENDPLESNSWAVLKNLTASARACSITHGGCETVPIYMANCASELMAQLRKLDMATLSSVPIAMSNGSDFFVESLAKLKLHDLHLKSRMVIGNAPQTVKATSRLIRLSISQDSKSSLISPMEVRRSIALSLDQLQDLWRLIVRYAISMQQPQRDVGVLVLDFLCTLLAAAGPIANLRSRMSFVQKYCLQWMACVEDYLKMLGMADGSLPQGLLNQISEMLLLSAQEIPEIIGAINEQFAPIVHNEHTHKLLGIPASSSHQSAISDLLHRVNSPHSVLKTTDQRHPHQLGILQVPEADEAWVEGGRPRKRLRLSSDHDFSDPASRTQSLCLRINRVLAGQETFELEGLSTIAPSRFRKLSEPDQCNVLNLLGLAACAHSHQRLSEDSVPDAASECIDCCLEQPKTDGVCKVTANVELLETLVALLPLVQKSVRARTAGLLSLRRLLMHTEAVDYLGIAQSPLGEWCLQSLCSSSRDVRVAASSTLKVFMLSRLSVPSDVIYHNRVTALEFLQSLWIKNETALQETSVLALTQVAQVCGDEELNIVLVRFVEYLGHPNSYISGLVYGELQKLAYSMKLPVSALLRPFWRTLGVTIIKNFQSRPSIAQNVCDLLGMKVDGLLILIEEFALPYLVLTQKHDLILRIALIHGPSMSTFDFCTQRRNLASILSFLLVQHSADSEESIMTLLSKVSPDFKEQDLGGWVRLNPEYIACELLKAIVDAGNSGAPRAYQALEFLAHLDHRRSVHSSGSRKSDVVGSFLETNVLGIITEYSNILNDVETRQPNAEKRRCLAAIGEVIKLGKSRVIVALPQICACLRSAMESKELCNKAFGSWAIMINTLKEEDIEPLVDQTIAVIVRSWDLFERDTQQLAYTVVSNLLKKHTALIREIFNTIPSLSSIPLMNKFETELDALKRQMDDRHGFMAFIKRLQNENSAVVEQALKELYNHLLQKQDFVYRSALREQPDSFVADLTRSLLDCCVRFNTSPEITLSCALCLGRIGCLDPNRIESSKEKPSLTVLANFAKADETVDFILHLLEHVIVKAFLSATSTRSQGFLAWAMQELLKLCDLDTANLRSRVSTSNTNYRKWLDLPEAVRNTLTPFLTSRYTVNAIVPKTECNYPIFSPELRHSEWLRTIVSDLLEKTASDNARLIFRICARLVKGQDISIPAFLLPFVVLNVVINGTESEKKSLIEELLAILRQSLSEGQQTDKNIKTCSESVFEILDHMSTWLQRKKKQVSTTLAKAERGIADLSVENANAHIKHIEAVLETIPPDLISRRAIECNSYARALFHWEQYIRQVKDESEDPDELFERLQQIYSQIDEPDGIEGISTQLHVLDIDQQILEHRKAGRWTAAQSWYELQLNEKPQDPDLQVNLLTCLRESGQYDVLLNRFDALHTGLSFPKVIPFAVEASWVMSQWDKLDGYVKHATNRTSDFATGIGKCLLAIQHNDRIRFDDTLEELFRVTATGLTTASIASFQACHDISLKLHALTELRDISTTTDDTRADVISAFDQRLDVIGSYVSDKHYLLGCRRAVMELTPGFTKYDIAASWLTSARLARKSGSTNQAFTAILRASALGDKSATIEQAKLMWMDGYHRKAIQTLEGAIESGAFRAHTFVPESGPVTLTTDQQQQQQQQQNMVTAKAYLLLGKWLDTAGQTQSEVIIRTYRKVTEYHRKWEKGWYYLGKHYNKILDSERAKPVGKESQIYLTGESAKLVIDNYLRSLVCGSKYIFQTLPKVLTLWLELVAGMEQPQDARRGNEKFNTHNAAQKKRVVEEANAQVKKYVEKMNAVVFYTILPQLVARICHPNQAVYNILVSMVVKVVRAFPQQALWPLLAMVKSQSKDRATRGLNIVSKIVEEQKKSGKDKSAADLRSMITQGQKFSDEVLRVSEFPIEGKVARVSLARDLAFNHKIAPSRLVVPIETCLMPSMPTMYESTNLKAFRPFSKDAVTISAFLDEALVLASLQKPRKLSIRGSDGKVYGVLAKPKDDMRKDQRLMEFNTMINRFLKHDVEASKRRLYIRTYAVVPLNEECGLIEWVDNLKTFRDIILKLYKERNIAPNYVDIRNLLDEACSGPPEKLRIFSEKILQNFPPVFHDWFVETFPDPSAWFTARLRYTRSCAVMSIVGHVLGLGDRHGENILFEEDNGGTLHVDFNCLFDKGLTFEKPECVPFRLTHNLVDAFGAYGYNGPFRRCCEITLTLLRGNEDALMTILETFLHDPTTDFINAGKRKKAGVAGVPDTPMGVLDGVRGKVRGMLAGESVPLSVGGYVEEMIKRATDEANLCRMYIGWCAFF